MTPSATTTEAKKDAALVAAVDVARAAAVDEVGEAMVGEHLGVVMEAERVATHSFACLNPAYLGWRWTVTIARAPRAKVITIDEVILLPGTDALVAPDWVPWSERVRPGDLGPGDVLPTAPDDPRLIAGLTGEDDLESVAALSPLHPGQWEIGLGRPRILSPLGRDDASDRWIEGDFGPTTPMARQSALDCATCGFMLPLGGPLGQAFAICANEISPADGRVVALAFGCGAHSEVETEPPARADVATDEVGWDPLDLGHS
jgi:hypothetical protein